MGAQSMNTGVRHRQKVRNALQGLVLLGGMIAIFALIAWLFFGGTGITA